MYRANKRADTLVGLLIDEEMRWEEAVNQSTACNESDEVYLYAKCERVLGTEMQ